MRSILSHKLCKGKDVWWKNNTVAPLQKISSIQHEKDHQFLLLKVTLKNKQIGNSGKNKIENDSGS
jgi:hypothetical protein